MKFTVDATYETKSIRSIVAAPDFEPELNFFVNVLEFKIAMISPADNPNYAILTRDQFTVALDKNAKAQPLSIEIPVENQSLIGTGLTGPNGTKVQYVPIVKNRNTIKNLKPIIHFSRMNDTEWVQGRAGMSYRSLTGIHNEICAASQIRIEGSGKVADWVHYHDVSFQTLFCINGSAKLVYEDQGEPFRLFAGNCVIQPPEIRHKVLYASDNIEVIEIGVPAEHITTIDHDMKLPTKVFNPEREFKGQKFVHNRADGATWSDFRIPGFKCRDTTIAANTKNVAGVQVIRPNGAAIKSSKHNCDILFNFVMEGGMTLTASDQPPNELTSGDAFVIPPNLSTEYSNVSKDLELLEVSLPGKFTTYYDT